MIIIRLVGGLGNQLFQYALGRNLAIKNNQELKIDVSGYAGNSPDAQKGVRVYGLANFNISAGEAKPEDLGSTRKFMGNSLSARIFRKINRMKSFLGSAYMVEPEAAYSIFQPKLLEKKINKNIYIEGYWQTEKYFIDIEDVIRKDFTFKNDTDGLNEEFIRKIGEGNSVAIHIRHGDNANSYAKSHGVLPMEYYMTAVKLLAGKVSNPHFYVFSDDPVWARNNLKLEYPTEYIDHNGDEKNYEDLRLMIACKHHITGNSTFSWWGAWLGKKPGQIVIAPKVYHVGKDISKKDFYPSSWILL